jgi:hypothetical protein
MSKNKTRKLPRDSRTGRIITLEEALRRPSTTEIETVKIPIKKRK